MMYQIDLEYDEWRLQALVSLLAQVVKEPFYDKLRTKEQLGYLVWSGSSEMWGVLGVRFILQSDKATVEYLQQRILTFVKNYRTILASMDKEKFEKGKDKHKDKDMKDKYEKGKEKEKEERNKPRVIAPPCFAFFTFFFFPVRFLFEISSF